MQRDTRECSTCRYFRRNPQHIGAGWCHFAAPLAVPVTQAGVPSVMSVRPPVSSAETCGQWCSTDSSEGAANV